MNIKVALTFLSIFLILGYAIPANADGPAMYETQLGKVCEVIDGDAVYIALEFDDSLKHGTCLYRAQLMGVNAPELYEKRPEKKPQCYAAKSKAMLEYLVLGKLVTIEWDKQKKHTDHGGHLLTYIRFGNTDINASMIANGYAFVPKRFPADRKEEYLALENEAIKNGLGAWGTCLTSKQLTRLKKQRGIKD